MLILHLSLVRAAKARFQSKDTWYLQLVPHGDACSVLLAHVVAKSRIFKRKKVTQLRHDVGEHSGLVRLLLVVVAVHEDIFLATVSMQIAIKHYLAFFLKLAD
jgi:hypothetical protein